MSRIKDIFIEELEKRGINYDASEFDYIDDSLISVLDVVEFSMLRYAEEMSNQNAAK